jgi:hypothetical protein
MPIATVGHPNEIFSDSIFVSNFFDVHCFGQDIHNQGFAIQRNDPLTNTFLFHKNPNLTYFGFLGKQKPRSTN